MARDASMSSKTDVAASAQGGEEAEEGEGGGGGGVSEEETILLIIGHIVKALCDQASEFGALHKKILADGVMNIVLKLSKIEVPILKLDMAVAMYSIAKADAGDVIKVLKSDSVDILFWQTIFDTLNLHDTILRNVARSLRCFSSLVDSCKLLVRQERFFSVIKALVKSKNEDVLWQTAAVLYNLLQVEVCAKALLEKGLISYIFDLAASNYDSVRHVCSACLHLIPNNMPDMDDPVVLQLVLCLLEADGEKFAQLGDKPSDVLPYNSLVERVFVGSLFKHSATGFSWSWNVLNCAIDSVFLPALIYEPDEKDLDMTHISTSKGGLELGSPVNGFESHEKICSGTYNDFQRETAAPLGLTDVGALNLTSPPLNAKAPPGYSTSPPKSPSLDEGLVAPHHHHHGNHHHGNNVSVGFDNKGTPGLNMSRDGIEGSRGNTSRNKLPLIQPSKSIPENTVNAINMSIVKQGKGSLQSSLNLSASGEGWGTLKSEAALSSPALTGKGLPAAVKKNMNGISHMSINQFGNNIGK